MLPSFPTYTETETETEGERERGRSDRNRGGFTCILCWVSFILSKSISVEERKEIEGILLSVRIELR
jgi:hypothetical protein